MGTSSIVLPIIGLCTCWIPGLGWFGVLLGLLGLAASIPSISLWYEKPGYTGWGISGLFLGVGAASFGVAYQLKHMGGVLDHLVIQVSMTTVALCWLSAGPLIALGLYLTRVKKKRFGMLLSTAALVAILIASTCGLITADKAYMEAQKATISEKG